MTVVGKFGSRATLETNLVYMDHNKYNQDLIDLSFERNELLAIHFMKRSIFKFIFITLTN